MKKKKLRGFLVVRTNKDQEKKINSQLSMLILLLLNWTNILLTLNLLLSDWWLLLYKLSLLLKKLGFLLRSKRWYITIDGDNLDCLTSNINLQDIWQKIIQHCHPIEHVTSFLLNYFWFKTKIFVFFRKVKETLRICWIQRMSSRSFVNNIKMAKFNKVKWNKKLIFVYVKFIDYVLNNQQIYLMN